MERIVTTQNTEVGAAGFNWWTTTGELGFDRKAMPDQIKTTVGNGEPWKKIYADEEGVYYVQPKTKFNLTVHYGY